MQVRVRLRPEAALRAFVKITVLKVGFCLRLINWTLCLYFIHCSSFLLRMTAEKEKMSQGKRVDGEGKEKGGGVRGREAKRLNKLLSAFHLW